MVASGAGPASGRGWGGGRDAVKGLRRAPYLPGSRREVAGGRSLLPASVDGFVASKIRDRY